MDTQSGSLRQVLGRLANAQTLTAEETERLFSIVMRGAAPPEQLAAILMAFHLRGETVEELSGAVRAVRQVMTTLPSVPENAMDVCGTGGDGLGTLNVSTAVAFVLAGLGVPVAKHGNRALSSRSGATDTLMALGIAPSEDLAQQTRRLKEDNLAFLSAPVHHPAMRHAAPVRGSLGFRTIFNLVGPLCNPACVRRQMIGVYEARWLEPVAQTLAALGGRCIWAVHGETDRGGSDEITLAGPSRMRAWEGDRFLDLVLTPEMAGFSRRPIAALAGGDPGYNAARLIEMLSGQAGAYRDTVLLNTAVALHVAGRASILENDTVSSDLLRRNVATAAQAIDSGLARSALARAQDADIRGDEAVSSPRMIQIAGLP